jgi:hypothetical protein
MTSFCVHTFPLSLVLNAALHTNCSPALISSYSHPDVASRFDGASKGMTLILCLMCMRKWADFIGDSTTAQGDDWCILFVVRSDTVLWIHKRFFRTWTFRTWFLQFPPFGHGFSAFGPVRYGSFGSGFFGHSSSGSGRFVHSSFGSRTFWSRFSLGFASFASPFLLNARHIQLQRSRSLSVLFLAL